ncbi:MAG: hypothetical protein LQ342_000613 [Letrouitia transgressa]|nr:MAG: hypothetical protein LQ342_000613 [Letrouitia transgressa]
MEVINNFRNELERPRGEVLITDQGYTFWRATDSEPWMDAVFHNSIRCTLILDAAQEGSYSYPRRVGAEVDDVTAFLRTQDWGINPSQWPPKVFQLLRTGSTEPTYHVPIWIWHGFVILDHEGLPMLNFKDLPATISSHEDGSILEGIIREDPRISDRDIAVRMPWGHTYMKMEPIIDSGSVVLRRLLFRNEAGCISWQETQPVRTLASPFVSPESRPSGMDTGEWLLDQPSEEDPSFFVTLVGRPGGPSGMATGERLLGQPLESNPSFFAVGRPSEVATGERLFGQPLEPAGMASGKWPFDQALEPDPSLFRPPVGGPSGMASRERVMAQLAELNLMRTTEFNGLEMEGGDTERGIELNGSLNQDLNPYHPPAPG